MIENRKSKIENQRDEGTTVNRYTEDRLWPVDRGLFRLHPKLLKHKLRNINLG